MEKGLKGLEEKGGSSLTQLGRQGLQSATAQSLHIELQGRVGSLHGDVLGRSHIEEQVVTGGLTWE